MLLTCAMYRYLGLMVVLTASATAYGDVLCYAGPLCFGIFITQCYIKREEAMLSNMFGADYQAYCERVSRWV